MPRLSKIPFTFDARPTLCVTLTLKCLLAKVEEHNPHVSSVVFVYHSSYADQSRTSDPNRHFRLIVRVGRHSPPTSMKNLAANPDRGAGRNQGTKYASVSDA